MEGFIIALVIFFIIKVFFLVVYPMLLEQPASDIKRHRIYVIDKTIINGLLKQKIKIEDLPSNSKFYTTAEQSDNVKAINAKYKTLALLESINMENDSMIKVALKNSWTVLTADKDLFETAKKRNCKATCLGNL